MDETVSPTPNSPWTTLQRSVLFWDVDVMTLNPSQHADWIVDRVLQFGQWDDWTAVFTLYPRQQIRNALRHRRVPHHIREFWQSYFEEEVNPVMHPQTLHPKTAALWQRYGSVLCPPGYLLAGGTALALYIGHRQSDDLDFMTMTAGDPARIINHLRELDPTTTLLDRSEHSFHVMMQGVKVSYLWQPGVRLDAGRVMDGISLASLSTLATLKCNAIANRGSRKDFVDMYALIQEGWSLAQILDAASDQAPSLNRAHVLRSFTYFVDAEAEPMPRVYRSWTWDEIQRTLTHVVHTYLQQHLRHPGSHGPKL